MRLVVSETHRDTSKALWRLVRLLTSRKENTGQLQATHLYEPTTANKRAMRQGVNVSIRSAFNA